MMMTADMGKKIYLRVFKTQSGQALSCGQQINQLNSQERSVV